MNRYLIVRIDTRLVNGHAKHSERVLKRLYMPVVDDGVIGSAMRQYDDIVTTARGYCRNERRPFHVTVIDPAGNYIWGCDVEGTLV